MDELEIKMDQLIGINQTSGKIAFIINANNDSLVEAIKEDYFFWFPRQKPSPYKWLMPGFIDTHFHAPQLYNQ
eukprot:Pgem_evm1s2263